MEDKSARGFAVALILRGEPERALKLLSSFYGVDVPHLKVGLPKGKGSALGCYDPNKRLICLRSSKEYRDPFVILHEFYHHLRFFGGKHRGTEKGANEYASVSIYYFFKALKSWRTEKAEIQLPKGKSSR